MKSVDVSLTPGEVARITLLTPIGYLTFEVSLGEGNCVRLRQFLPSDQVFVSRPAEPFPG